MAQTATYTLDRFIADVKQMFASTTDPRAQAQAVANHMRELLAEPGWLEEKLQPLPHLRNHLVFSFKELGGSQHRLARKLDAPFRSFADLGEKFGAGKKGLGRDTAAVQTHAA